MRGIILTNAYWHTEESDYQPIRLKEEFAALGVSVDIKNNDFFAVSIDNGTIKNELKNYDFCIYWDKDKYVLAGLEKTGMKVYNGYGAITICDDKMLTYIALANHGIKMPKTVPGMLCYNANETVRQAELEKVEKELGYPMVIKESVGSLGSGVYLVSDRKELNEIAEKVKCKRHLYQELIKASCGKDVRVIVVGGKVLGAMQRKSDKNFCVNISLGGVGEKYSLDEKTTSIALKIAKILNLNYCGIDFLLNEQGDAVVCEVNSNAFFRGFEKVTGINVARAYAEYVINDCNN